MRHAVTLLLVFSLAVTPAFAQTIRDSAVRHAVQAAQKQETEISAGLKWSAVGLLAGGAGALLTGIVIENECQDFESDGRGLRDAECHRTATIFKVFGGIVSGTGVVLLVIGHAKRRPVTPSITVQRGRVLLQQRVSF